MKTPKKQKIIVIVGPTASGKSKLGIKIALRLHSGQAKKLGIKGGEIISADSRQVYKKLNIGTEKIAKKEMKGVKHYMIDIADPKKTYTVAQYQRSGQKILNQIIQKGKIPIIVGGTGFYIDALIYGYKLPAVAPQKKLRKKLEQKSAEELFRQLEKLDPQRAKNIDKKNKVRLVRALEIILTTGQPIAEISRQSPYQILKIGIKKSPAELRELINKRLEKTLKKGLLKETKNLRKYLGWKRLEELGLEYRLAADYLRGKIPYLQMVEKMRTEIYRYTKRQMTWFKKNKSIHWLAKPKKSFSLIKTFLLK